MTMSVLLRVESVFRRTQFVSALMIVFVLSAGATGPVFFDNDEAVSIYRDFDDGLFGRSLYRGVMFSVKLDSFARYRSLPVRDMDGLTGYLLSGDTAEALSESRVPGVIRQERVAGIPVTEGDEPGMWLYRFSRDGIDVVFSLERVPEDLLEEVDRTYPDNRPVAEQVKESYRSSWVIRIHVAENVYRPGVGLIDYEDVMVSAALLADDFQPLWGLHDGNALVSGNW